MTALGVGWKANAEGFRQGRVAIRPITLFDASKQRVQVAGEVALPPALPGTRLTARQVGRLDRAAKLLLLAAAEAWQQAGWKPSPALPAVLGTTSGGMSLGHLLGAAGAVLVGDPGTFLQGLALGAEWLLDERVEACLVIGAYFVVSDGKRL